MRLEENCRRSDSFETPWVNAGVKNSQGIIIIIIIIIIIEDYIQKHEGGLITPTRNDTENTMNNRMKITRKQKWERKQLYGRFKRRINNISHDKTWTWLRKGNFKRETASLQIAAQNNAVRTNHIQARIDNTQ